MAIVISGVNNNDKITASDGTIDLLSGVNFNSEITVPSFKVGSNIQIGNAGIITATTFTGNVTGNINNDILLLQTGSYERVRIDSSGRVLIGTTTEGHENADDLTIATSGTGGITIRSGTSNSGAIYFSDATSGTAEYAGFLAYSHANNSMVFGTNTAEKLRIMSNGYIGLGINSPSRRVHIHTTGSGSDYIQFTNDTTGTTTGDGYVFGINGDEDVIHNNLEATNMRFYTAGAERLRIDSSGNFNLGLIGTPLSSSTEQGVYLAGADSTQSVISSNVTPFVVNRVGTGGNDRNCIEFRNNGSLKGTVGAVGVNNGIFFQSGVTEVMRITSDYKVIVGMTTTTTTTSNNNLELAGTKMLKVGSMYIGYVIGTGNNGSGVLILHKMGQNIGLQFSGMVTVHSYTGTAYLSGCIAVRYNTDAVTRDVTLQKAQSGMNFQIVSGTISGESGTYFGIKKNGVGTGSFYINAFVAGNIETYGGIREISNSDWTTDTVHGSGIT